MTAELEAARDRSDEITVTINRRFAAELLSHADDEISAWPTETAYVRDLQDFITQINKAMIETHADATLAAAPATPEIAELLAELQNLHDVILYQALGGHNPPNARIYECNGKPTKFKARDIKTPASKAITALTALQTDLAAAVSRAEAAEAKVLKWETAEPSEQRKKYQTVAARISVGKASQEEAVRSILALCRDNERLSVMCSKHRDRANSASTKITERIDMLPTPRQLAALDFIRAFIAEHRYAPTVTEIGEAIGSKSKNSVHRLLIGLEERNLIRRLPNRARAIEVVEDRP